jgi:ribose/xylose/arabinose/galactoside ABC-type transport system permease subunit
MAMTLVVVFAAMSLIFYFNNPLFFTIKNLQAIFGNMSLIGLLAIGLTFVVLTGNVDLSIGSTVGTTAVVVANLFDLGFSIPIPFVFLIGIMVGVVIGAVNGFLVAVVGINSVIVTLGTLFVNYGISLIVGSRTAFVYNETFISIGRSNLFEVIPYTFIIMIVLLVLMYLVLRFTKFGNDVYLVGSNQNAATFVGINIKKIIFFTFIISGAFASISGILLTAQLAYAQGGFGAGWNFRALVICFIGGISIRGGRGTLVGVALSILVITTLSNGLTLASVPINWRDAFEGTLLIGSIVLDSVRVRRELRPALK